MVVQNQADWIEAKIEDAMKLPDIGRVDGVTTHDSTGDYSNHEVDVKLRDSGKTLHDVGIAVNHGGEARVPTEGDIVLVGYTSGNVENPYIADFLYTNQTRAPLAKEGDYRLRVNDMYLELQPNEDVARLSVKSSGDLSTPDAKVEVDNSGSATSINIETDGDVTIDATGNIYLAGSGGSPVARQGDPVSGTTSDGASFDGQIDDGSNNVSAN